MRYRWKVKEEFEDHDTHELYLILDGRKYLFAVVEYLAFRNQWDVFIVGFVSEGKLEGVEEAYDLLSEAKRIVQNYAKAWFISGEFGRMNDAERNSWYENSL